MEPGKTPKPATSTGFNSFSEPDGASRLFVFNSHKLAEIA